MKLRFGQYVAVGTLQDAGYDAWNAIGAHMGHGGMQYLGKDNGWPSFRCYGCGDVVFAAAPATESKKEGTK